MRWHRNISHHSLVFSDYSRNGSSMHIPRGRIAYLELKANQDILDFNQAMKVFPGRHIEVIGQKEELLYSEVRIDLENVMPPDFYAEVRRDQNQRDFLYVESKVGHWSRLDIYLSSGQSIQTSKVWFDPGLTMIDLPSEIPQGLYLCTLRGHDSFALKWMKQ